eukprot:6426898-Pyramimonas_sp.AAC.1
MLSHRPPRRAGRLRARLPRGVRPPARQVAAAPARRGPPELLPLARRAQGRGRAAKGGGRGHGRLPAPSAGVRPPGAGDQARPPGAAGGA